MKNTQPVYYRFKTYEEIYQSHNWRLEIDVATQRTLLGLPYWIDIEILHDYEPDPHPEQDLTAATLSQHDSNSPEPALVSPTTSKNRSRRKKASSVQHLSTILDKWVPAGNLPEPLVDGITDSVSDSLDRGSDV